MCGGYNANKPAVAFKTAIKIINHTIFGFGLVFIENIIQCILFFCRLENENKTTCNQIPNKDHLRIVLKVKQLFSLLAPIQFPCVSGQFIKATFV